jgi:hypothetical protein
MAGTDWSDKENDAIVASYFAMLQEDVAGRPYNKSEHRRALVANIGRSEGSVEFKHQNVSAVLVGLGHTWINGYKPLPNFQDSLVDAVARHLAVASLPAQAPTSQGFSDSAPLYFETPPTLRNAPPPVEAAKYMAIARRFDAAGRDERNRALGAAGEERLLLHERVSLRQNGRDDLAAKVRWTSKEDGDGAGYDIASFTPDGAPRLIEVKTTNGWDRTPFHISRNELQVAQDRRENWCLVRLYNFARAPKAFELRPPLDAHVSLMPTSFQADFH